MGARGSACPCGSGRGYDDCCARWHHGAPAPDAEALMRARYCAYALKLTDYLRATWHPRTRPPALSLDDAPGAATAWLGLQVKSHRVVDADNAEVEFVARYRVGGGSAVRMRERSRFVRENGVWLYLDAID